MGSNQSLGKAGRSRNVCVHWCWWPLTLAQAAGVPPRLLSPCSHLPLHSSRPRLQRDFAGCLGVHVSDKPWLRPRPGQCHLMPQLPELGWLDDLWPWQPLGRWLIPVHVGTRPRAGLRMPRGHHYIPWGTCRLVQFAPLPHPSKCSSQVPGGKAENTEPGRISSMLPAREGLVFLPWLSLRRPPAGSPSTVSTAGSHPGACSPPRTLG